MRRHGNEYFIEMRSSTVFEAEDEGIEAQLNAGKLSTYGINNPSRVKNPC